MENSVEKAMPESNNICRICIFFTIYTKENGEKFDTFNGDREHFCASKVKKQVCTEESNIANRYFQI